jgi:hypothetical protein
MTHQVPVDVASYRRSGRPCAPGRIPVTSLFRNVLHLSLHKRLTTEILQEKRSHSARFRQKPRQVPAAARVVPPLRAALRSRAHTCHAFMWLHRAPFGRLRLYAIASSRRPSNDATCRWPAADLMNRPPLRCGRTTKVDRRLLPPSLRAGQIAASASHYIRRAGLPVQHGRPRGDGGESSWSVRSSDLLSPVPGAATFQHAFILLSTLLPTMHAAAGDRRQNRSKRHLAVGPSGRGHESLDLAFKANGCWLS